MQIDANSRSLRYNTEQRAASTQRSTNTKQRKYSWPVTKALRIIYEFNRNLLPPHTPRTHTKTLQIQKKKMIKFGNLYAMIIILTPIWCWCRRQCPLPIPNCRIDDTIRVSISVDAPANHTQEQNEVWKIQIKLAFQHEKDNENEKKNNMISVAAA